MASDEGRHNEMAGGPALNPKHAAGRAKASFHTIPPVAIEALGGVMALGAAKYGAFNYSKTGVVASVYIDAIYRHLMAYISGQNADAESGQPHLAHIMACCAIIIECNKIGNLLDDRSLDVAACCHTQVPETKS